MQFRRRDRPEIEELTGQRWVPVLVHEGQVDPRLAPHPRVPRLARRAQGGRVSRMAPSSPRRPPRVADRADGVGALAEPAAAREGALQAPGAEYAKRGRKASSSAAASSAELLAAVSPCPPTLRRMQPPHPELLRSGPRRSRRRREPRQPRMGRAGRPRGGRPPDRALETTPLVQPVLEPDRPLRRLGLRLGSSSSGCSTPSSSASSPDSNISMMMSEPPTSSLFTNSWGIVGQPDSPDSSSRMRGSGRMSSAAYWTPSALSAPGRARREAARGLVGRALHEQHHAVLVDRLLDEVADLVVGHGVAPGVEVLMESAWMAPPISCAEHVVDQLVLLDPRQALEPVRHDLGAEMVAAAGEVVDPDLRARQRRSDALLEFCRCWHS